MAGRTITLQGGRDVTEPDSDSISFDDAIAAINAAQPASWGDWQAVNNLFDTIQAMCGQNEQLFQQYWDAENPQ